MLYDIAMPITLFAVTLASLFLNKRTESKLKSTLEERAFGAKDAILLAAGMAIVVSLIVLLPQLLFMALFLFSYSMLLFLFTFTFTNERFYPEVAVLPSALFIVFYFITRQTPIWSVYLINVYAVIFAIMITLYLQPLFTWKSSLIFVALITCADIVLVLVTRTMISVATETVNLQLPVLVTVPMIPLLGRMSLGLGDFFFAGLLSIQTARKYDICFALMCMAAMTASFFIFEAFLLTYRISAFPGTVMIIAGWLPLAGAKYLASRRKKKASLFS